ncbi:pyridoxine/pyridoxamine 5'-phosphate oxidase 2 isoform X2 [Hevea brasiliensis]|uniref:pyridoxine/pyridoxamine 5'-phosphate oxidase 2 isoform X2 n=1 Tax=Hevea brasiliensis TaxID=3981 RepID=UPI000B78608A|nr:pyridoxine/pyridoxamine 5'-phosphate oxidase 2 isoform X2 [Hevea brasiliensis]
MKVSSMGTVIATPWKQLLLSALESNSHLKHSSFFQFATVGSDGRPSNRTVVFRGFAENSDKILINTDSRTRKIEELKQCPFAEICWYFTDSWEQFRINGRVNIIDGLNPDPAKLQALKWCSFGKIMLSASVGSDNAKIDVMDAAHEEKEMNLRYISIPSPHKHLKSQ